MQAVLYSNVSHTFLFRDSLPTEGPDWIGSEVPSTSSQSAHEGGETVRRDTLVLISVRVSVTPGPQCGRKDKPIKCLNDNIRYRTRDLPACSAVPQPTAPKRAHSHISARAVHVHDHF